MTGDVPLVVPVAGRFNMETGIEHHVYGANKRSLDEGKSVMIKDPSGRDRRVSEDFPGVIDMDAYMSHRHGWIHESYSLMDTQKSI